MQHLLSFLAAVAAVNGSPVPVPQGVTEDIAPAGGMPAGCMASRSGVFGIAIMAGTDTLGATQAADGQPAAATQIADGQPQAGAVNQISDGQVQAMTQIADGQIQGPMPTCAASQISDGQVQGCMMPMPAGAAATQIADGQVQAQPTPAVPAASQISDGQVQGNGAPVASQIGDGQPQAPAATQIADGQVQPAGMSSGMTTCMTDGTLMLTLDNGVLMDDQNRTGYIAANYQFQFDAPAQTGAIYTAGFSICEGGVMALGDDKVFYRCRSGDFYNLYNENWAPQCEAVTVRAVDIVQC